MKPFLGEVGRVYAGRRGVLWLLIGSVFSATGLFGYTLMFSDVTVVLPLSHNALIWVVLLGLVFMGGMGIHGERRQGPARALVR